MPRLSDIDYIRNHIALRNERITRHANGFAYVTPIDQSVLHDYYEPSLELDAIQLITHRRAIMAKSPALPQAAGKAFARIQSFLDMPPTVYMPGNVKRKRSEHNVMVMSVVNPHPGIEKIAQILIEMMGSRPGLGSTQDPEQDKSFRK